MGAEGPGGYDYDKRIEKTDLRSALKSLEKSMAAGSRTEIYSFTSDTGFEVMVDYTGDDERTLTLRKNGLQGDIIITGDDIHLHDLKMYGDTGVHGKEHPNRQQEFKDEAARLLQSGELDKYRSDGNGQFELPV